jgi:stalled ribosome rescue protein Dom34
MSFNHAVVWLDHAEAHILHFNAESSESATLKSHTRYPKHSRSGDKHAMPDPHFYAGIAAALADAKEILITGPGQEKVAFAKHLEYHLPGTADKVVGVETVDHPTDPQLLAYARKYFLKVDLFR